jgi:hypothetical protein
MLAMRRNLTPLPGAAAVLLAAPADLLCLAWINRTVSLLKTGAFGSLSGTICDHSFYLMSLRHDHRRSHQLNIAAVNMLECTLCVTSRHVAIEPLWSKIHMRRMPLFL